MRKKTKPELNQENDLQVKEEVSDVKVEVTRLFRRIEKYKCQTIVVSGGSGSSKTYSLSQLFIFKRLLVRRNYKLLILRKNRTACKGSVYKIFIDLLKQYKIYNESNHNKSDLEYYFPDMNSYVKFGGLEDREQIKSTEWNDIWMEESNQFSKIDYLFLKTRLYRGSLEYTDRPRIWMSFNPEDCWIFDLEGKKNVDLLYSNYKDNEFCNEEYIQTLMELKEEDEVTWKIYALGKRARAGNLVYKPYRMEKMYPTEMQDEIYGLDFGYNHPAALLWIGYRDEERYLKELLYKTRLTDDDLIDQLKILIPEEKRVLPIYGDSAEPEKIQTICNAGFNCQPCKKGKGSVKAGIDFCKLKIYHTLEINQNLNRESAGYRYKQDKDGNVMEDPVKFRDHLMDAKRYAEYTHANTMNLRIR